MKRLILLLAVMLLALPVMAYCPNPHTECHWEGIDCPNGIGCTWVCYDKCY
jgi:hypothetical protein